MENSEANRACLAGFGEAVHALPPPSSSSSSGLPGRAMPAESQGLELRGLKGWNWVQSGKRQRGMPGPRRRLEDHPTQEQQRGPFPQQVNSRASLMGWDCFRPGIAERAGVWRLESPAPSLAASFREVPLALRAVVFPSV